MNNTAKVSVVVATHNNAEYIDECLDSILSQAFSDIEVIVVDVNSSDGTKEFLADTAKADSRVVFLADSMGSMGHARNKALHYVRTPYVIFVGADDIVGRNMIEYLYLKMEEDPENDVRTCEIDSFGDDAFDRTNEDIKRINYEANQKDNRRQEWDSRLFRSQVFERIAIYKTTFLRDNNIVFYDIPGIGSQDTAFKFFALMHSHLCIDVEILYHRRLDAKKEMTDNKHILDVCSEYRYLRKKLKEDEKDWQRMRYVFWQAYYDSNMRLYERLSDNQQNQLARQMQSDLKTAIQQGEYSEDHFDILVKHEMKLLMRSADEFVSYQSDRIRKRKEKRRVQEERENRISDILREEEEELQRQSKKNKIETVAKKQMYRIDRKWLLDEMSKDLAPLRMLLGFSADEMGGMLGISSAVYKNLEGGKREMSWDQFMALLFLFHYNERTAPIVDSLGLYPESLKLRMKNGFCISY